MILKSPFNILERNKLIPESDNFFYVEAVEIRWFKETRKEPLM